MATRSDYLPEILLPALIKNANSCEPDLLVVPNDQQLSERLNDHYSPGPDYWGPNDRLIDCDGKVFSFSWSPNDVTGGDYDLIDTKERYKPLQLCQLVRN